MERLAAADVVNYSLSDFDTLSKVAAAEGYIADKDIAKLTAFQKNPRTRLGWNCKQKEWSLCAIV